MQHVRFNALAAILVLSTIMLTTIDGSQSSVFAQNVNGDKGYYDGFVQGCMGTDSINTQELCESYVVECLRATSIDSSETCDADVDTTSSAWKLIMTRPS